MVATACVETEEEGEEEETLCALAAADITEGDVLM